MISRYQTNAQRNPWPAFVAPRTRGTFSGAGERHHRTYRAELCFHPPNSTLVVRPRFVFGVRPASGGHVSSVRLIVFSATQFCSGDPLAVREDVCTRRSIVLGCRGR